MQKAILSSRVRLNNRSMFYKGINCLYAEIDQETFKVMWDLSAPGGDAEGCFLRIHQTDYFYDGRDCHLDWMPDVSICLGISMRPCLTRVLA